MPLSCLKILSQFPAFLASPRFTGRLATTRVSSVPFALTHHVPVALFFLFFGTPGSFLPQGLRTCWSSPGAFPYLPFTSSVNPHQVSAQVSSPPRGLPWSPCLEYLCSPQFIVCLSHWNVNSRRAGTLFIVPYPKLRTMLGT